MMRHPTHRPSATPPAFTLIEVLLAVGLATALLLAALFFYRQAAQLRSDILQSSRAIAALRLALDQLASDLRAAVPAQGHAFAGGPASLEFTRFSTPSPASPSTNLAHNPPDAPLAVVFLSTLIQTDGTNLVVQGISRRSQPLGPQPRPAGVATNLPTPDINPETDPLAPVAALPTPAPGPTHATLTHPSPAQAPLLPVRFLLLRYWNGTDWQDSWLAPNPPHGVEITLGLEPLPNDMPPEAYPHERFTRVVFIPAGQNPPPSTLTNLPPTNPAEASP